MDRDRVGLGEYLRLAGWAAVVFAVVYVVASHLEVIRNVIIVAIGFGAVIMIHEFGHFSIAKLSGMKVEAFSIGFPPVLVGILRMENGYRIRVLPGFARREEGERAEGDDGSVYKFMIGNKAKPGETEYRIGLIPFGGFVKVLGQEDVKGAEAGRGGGRDFQRGERGAGFYGCVFSGCAASSGGGGGRRAGFAGSAGGAAGGG
jgi:uncharacterized membrane protein YgcG